MRSKIKTPVPYSVNGLVTTLAIDSCKDRSSAIIEDKHKNWFSKLKRQRPKRFTCPHCQIAFSNNGQLIGHIRTHTGIHVFPQNFVFLLFLSQFFKTYFFVTFLINHLNSLFRKTFQNIH